MTVETRMSLAVGERLQ